MTVLITGGAGYIGSHAILAFRAAGYGVIVLDNLSTGCRDTVPADVPFIKCNADDMERVQAIIKTYGIASVVHFAGSLVVPESVEKPLTYYHNNTATSRSLLEVCVKCGVPHFIFSSTCAIYGIVDELPITEKTATQPINPYGRSKLMTEQILHDTAAAHKLSFVSLRYFNVAGADPKGRVGQSTPQATQLIKVACEAMVGKREAVTIFGEDYDTPDGTCIRDYIHVSDLVAAHVRALHYLEAGGESQVLNCGYGHGFSVKEILEKIQEVAGRKLDIRKGPRRPGDPPELVADPSQIQKILGWQPIHNDLLEIIDSALRWERKLVHLT